MLRITNIRLPLGYTDELLRAKIARAVHLPPEQITRTRLVRRAVDARRELCFIAAADIAVKQEDAILKKGYPNVSKAPVFSMPEYGKQQLPHAPVIIGLGPAGLFAAWVLAQAGLCPVVLERGKAVPERQKAVAEYHRTGKLDPECNVQFGEGGAGTFSDGKLNTGTKDPRIRQVLQTLHECGAPEEILWQAKPHVGTDRLAVCIPALRKRIEAAGGKVLFGAKCTGFTAQDGQLISVEYTQNNEQHSLRTDHAVFAIGHSARDLFAYFSERGLPMEQKPFSLGFRIEHLQTEIDRLCYGKSAGHPQLGAASYKVAAHLPDGRGIYSFCMCPGGTVQAAASEPETVVTNGMSNFARDAVNANSAVLVGISPADFGSDDVLAGMHLQRKIERAAYLAGGSTGKAPVILLTDFLKKQKSAAFGRVQPSYPLGTAFALPDVFLPEWICASLRQGIPLLDRGLHGFCQPDAVLTAPETRSSSPLRILRNAETLESLGVHGLYPCGEGAGYAGGIVSAAVDGIRCAERILVNV